MFEKTRGARCIMGEEKQTQLESLISDGLKYEVIEKRKAAERKALTRKNGLKIEDAKYLDGTKGQTRDIVAKKLGISGKHWDRIKYIYQHRELIDEQKYNNWIAGKLSTSKLYTELSNKEKADDACLVAKEIVQEMQYDILSYISKDRLRAIKDKLNYTLYNYPDKVKKDVFDSLELNNKEWAEFVYSISLKLLTLEKTINRLN